MDELGEGERGGLKLGSVKLERIEKSNDCGFGGGGGFEGNRRVLGGLKVIKGHQGLGTFG